MSSAIMSNSVKGSTKAAELFQGQVLLYRHLYSFFNPMCLKWAVQLGIPDIIHSHGQPITLPELVSALNVPPARIGPIQRLMRLLAHNGFFAMVRIHDKEEEKEAYALTPASELLVQGTNHCLSPMVLWVTTPALIDINHQWRDWTYGEKETIFETALGAPCYEVIHSNPEHMKAFNEGMASDSQTIDLALKDYHSVFEGLGSIVDVGGGTGTIAKIICEACPKLKFIVLDLPQVVANLPGSDSLSYVGGDMFKSIPQADAILLKCVLHNWSDEDCKRLLKNCRDAIPSGGKVIIIDMVINEKQDEDEITELKLLLDIAMMGLAGKERNEKEWKQLFVEAGFKRYKIYPIFGFRSLIEIYP